MTPSEKFFDAIYRGDILTIKRFLNNGIDCATLADEDEDCLTYALKNKKIEIALEIFEVLFPNIKDLTNQIRTKASCESIKNQDFQRIKCICLGSNSPGITTCLERYEEGRFTSFIPSAGIDFKHKRDTIVDNIEWMLQLWEIASRPNDSHLIIPYAKTAYVHILFYDISNESSYQGIKNLAKIFSGNKLEKIPKILVGTKIDLRGSQNINCFTYEQGKMLADEIGAFKYLECSSLNGNGVSQIFRQAGKLFIDNQQKLNFYAFNDSVPDNAKKHLKDGFNFIENEEYTSAIVSFDNALITSPRYVDAFYGMGLAQIKYGNRKVALYYYLLTLKFDLFYQCADGKLLLSHVMDLNRKVMKEAINIALRNKIIKLENSNREFNDVLAVKKEVALRRKVISYLNNRPHNINLEEYYQVVFW